MGLTAKQKMVYASKVKNSHFGKDIDHVRNVQQIVDNFLISDTMNIKAGNCSGEQQKRLAIALELTAFHEPNVIFCDEPTTGLDSYIPEVVSLCYFKISIN